MADQIHCRDEAHYRELKAKIAVYDSKVTEYKSVTNEERSAVETWEFQHGETDRYFAYVNLVNRIVTTWTGQILGKITNVGSEWRDVFGGRRVPINVVGINGVVYHGTYFKSSGDYCRLKAKRHKGSIVKYLI